MSTIEVVSIIIVFFSKLTQHFITLLRELLHNSWRKNQKERCLPKTRRQWPWRNWSRRKRQHAKPKRRKRKIVWRGCVLCALNADGASQKYNPARTNWTLFKWMPLELCCLQRKMVGFWILSFLKIKINQRLTLKEISHRTKPIHQPYFSSKTPWSGPKTCCVCWLHDIAHPSRYICAWIQIWEGWCPCHFAKIHLRFRRHPRSHHQQHLCCETGGGKILDRCPPSIFYPWVGADWNDHQIGRTSALHSDFAWTWVLFFSLIFFHFLFVIREESPQYSPASPQNSPYEVSPGGSPAYSPSSPAYVPVSPEHANTLHAGYFCKLKKN